MQKLITEIAEEMSKAAAQQGADIPPGKLYTGVKQDLRAAELILHSHTVQSIPPRFWASLIAHARLNKIDVRDVLMQMLFDSLSRPTLTINKMVQLREQAKTKPTRPKPKLTLVK